MASDQAFVDFVVDQIKGAGHITFRKMFGEYGTQRRFAFEKMFRDAKLLELGAGTTVINLMTAARNELGLVK